MDADCVVVMTAEDWPVFEAFWNSRYGVTPFLLQDRRKALVFNQKSGMQPSPQLRAWCVSNGFAFWALDLASQGRSVDRFWREILRGEEGTATTCACLLC